MQTIAPEQPGRDARDRGDASGSRSAPGRSTDRRCFLLPAAIVYSLFVLFPLVQAGYYGLYRWNGLGPLAGLRRAGQLHARAERQVFQRRAAATTSSSSALSLIIQLPLALGLALLVGAAMRGRAIFRTDLLPAVRALRSRHRRDLELSSITRNRASTICSARSSPASSRAAGWATPNTVLYALFVVITWKFFGFHFILYLAGLQNIPAELEEAAQIDGASHARASSATSRSRCSGRRSASRSSCRCWARSSSST